MEPQENSERAFSNRTLTAIAAPSPAPLLHDRLIDQRIDLLPVVPADWSGRGRQINNDQLFLRIGPPVGAAGAGPGELPDRAHHPDHTWRGAHGKPETKTVIGPGRIGVADQV